MLEIDVSNCVDTKDKLEFTITGESGTEFTITDLHDRIDGDTREMNITGGTITLTSCIDSFLTMTDVRVTGWWCMLLRIPILMFGVCTLRCTAGGHGICRRLDVRGANF